MGVVGVTDLVVAGGGALGADERFDGDAGHHVPVRAQHPDTGARFDVVQPHALVVVTGQRQTQRRVAGHTQRVFVAAACAHITK